MFVQEIIPLKPEVTSKQPSVSSIAKIVAFNVENVVLYSTTISKLTISVRVLQSIKILIRKILE